VTSQYSTSNKEKRSLYGLSDQEYLSQDFIKSHDQLFNHVIHHAGLPYSYNSQPQQFGNNNFGIDYLNYGVPLISNHLSPLDNSYISNGRILKQYSVKEFSNDQAHSLATTNGNHPGGRKFLFETHKTPFVGQVQVPYVVHSPFARAMPTNRYLPTNFSPLLNLPTNFQLIPQQPQLFQPAGQRNPAAVVNLAKNHGPVALGSGALGYIRLANGDIYLGSGSLGYINQQQHTSDITSAVLRKGKESQAGPLSFGHNN
jgi:hypothetical protein